MKIKEGFRFIDLFCGIGGFHQALSSLGGKCVFASDIDKECQITYEENYRLKPHSDITKISEEQIPSHDVLCGGFPCQSFSKAGNRLGVEDPRGTLFFDIVRIAKFHKPAYMILENVRNLAGHDEGRTWTIILKTLKQIGYDVLPEPIIFSPHYIGIPQHRERVYILCKRIDIGSVAPFYFKHKRNEECSLETILLDDSEIKNIEDYKIEKEKVEIIELWNEFVKNIKAPLPGFPVWADRLKELDIDEDLEQYPDWKKNFILKNNSLYLNNKIFLNKWLKKAFANTNFKGSKSLFEWQAGQTEEPNIWENIMQFRPSGLRIKKPTHSPALVAITQTSIIGTRKRYLTPRECARLQSFPDNFKLNAIDRIAYKQLGNSVNVAVVVLFAKFLFGDKEVIQEYKPKEISKQLQIPIEVE